MYGIFTTIYPINGQKLGIYIYILYMEHMGYINDSNW